MVVDQRDADRHRSGIAPPHRWSHPAKPLPVVRSCNGVAFAICAARKAWDHSAASYVIAFSLERAVPMSLIRRRPRLAALFAAVAALALVATLILVNQPGAGPELLGAGGTLPVTAAESANGPVDMGNGHFVGADQHHDKSPELRTIKPIPVRGVPLDEEEDGEGGGRVTRGSTGPAAPVQNQLASPAMPATSLSFDGIPFPGVVCNCAPPDTNGEVGATQYVQIVNEGFQVFDKATGASQYGPAAISTIWSGAGNVCATAGHGDPVVLYDQLAGRWLISQFAGSSIPTDECIAISTTSDARGSWYRYDFHLSSNFMDYPHGAVWPDGYYFAFNVYNSAGTSFIGPQPVVFDRAKMLLGQAATFQTTGPRSSGDTFLPADVDGSTAPPANAPETFVSFPDFGTYTTYHYKINWTTPASSTWTTFASPAAGGFTLLCSATRSCVPQGGTTAKLDAIADRLMFRLAYRNFGDHEAVVGNYTVSSGGVAGIRWFELRNVTAGPVTVFQESTYQPDTTWRWMGSAAMDKNGDLALGFSASSASVVPGLRYAGRLVGDPLNTLAQGEATLFAGAGSQSGTSSRWGDYADLTIDPVDDCTFWFTSEYYPSGVSQFNSRTRIGSFSFPSCTGTTPTTGNITGTVTDASTSSPISGATVAISGGGSTSTDGAGHYAFSNLTPATYSLTASKTGYVASAPANVNVTAGGTATQNFALTPNAGSHTSSAYAGSSAAGAGGDGNGYETNRINLTGAPNGAAATDVNSGTSSSTSCTSTARDKEIAAGYAFSNLGTSILGIQVALTGSVSSTKNGPKFCVQLSWDGGTSWTAGKTTGSLTTTTSTFTLGGTADTWGHAWTAAELGSGSFRVRIIDLANSTSRTFSLDAVGVTVTSQ
jgi:hypothetical protein